MSDEPEPSTTKVRRALYEAQKAVGGIGKDSTAKVNSKKGTGASYSYKYTSSEDMIAHARHALLDAGLSWEMVGWELCEPIPTASCPTLRGFFELCHGESGEILRREYSMPVASRNDTDKAVAGAITYLLGQATRALLMIPKVSDEASKLDPDKRDSDHGGWQPRETTRTVAKSSAVQPPAKDPKAEYNALVEECRDLVLDLEQFIGKIDGPSTKKLREDAGVPPEGKMTLGNLKTYRAYLKERVASSRYEDSGDQLFGDDGQGSLPTEGAA